MAEKKNRIDKEEEDGILLYYKYAGVPDVDDLVRFYESNCKSLALLGRVRIAPDGVNVTVGGKLSSLEKHIAAVSLNELFQGTDFKLASCSSPSDDKIAKESGFTSLSIRIVKELVTLSPHPLIKSPAISNAGKHLSAAEFHSALSGNISENDGASEEKKIILLDARNVYETRIGKFQTSNVETLDPEIRQYSDLPSWIDAHSDQLRGNNVLMYCTGGIRCEMASAYIRSKGADFENVYQLYGGIQRYLEQFPDGGYFKGKNFVFDHRISVGSSNADIVGSCLLCGSSFDDYSSRCRCTYCRMLVLVCDSCQEKNDAIYACELCQRQGKGSGLASMVRTSEHSTETTSDNGPVAIELESATMYDHTITSPELPRTNGPSSPRKLRILCLHGFRQNASSFKGRTASLAKKLKSIAELVFIDAPHELPFIYRPRPAETTHGTPDSERQNDSPPPETCKKKYAWLVAQEMNSSMGTDWKMADEPFDPLQYRQQTNGLDASLAYLKSVFSQEGPFDGVLGFSQGAAMTAALCAQRGRRSNAELDFKFAILCSGFALNLGETELGSINCPSVHVFGNRQGKDRQIERYASMELASLFEQSCSLIIEHESGHIIPTQSPYIDQLKSFLLQFL